MHPLGERFRQPVGQSLRHDRAVVVVRRLQRRRVLVRPDARRYRECADVVPNARHARRNVIRQAEVASRQVRPRPRLVSLLAQEVKPRRLFAVRPVHLHVVSYGVGGPEADRGPCRQRVLRDHLVQQILHVAEQRPRLAPVGRVVQDGGIGAAQLPRQEERRPVYALQKISKRVVVECLDACERRRRRRGGSPVERLPPRPRLRYRQQLRPPPARRPILPQTGVPRPRILQQLSPAVVSHQVAERGYSTRRVPNVDDAFRVLRFDADGCVSYRCRRAAYQ